MKIATKSKRRWWERSFGRWKKEILWNSVNYEQSYRRSCWPSLSRQCAFGNANAYANAFEFGPRDFDAGEILPSFYPSFPNFPQWDLWRRADSRWTLPQISSLNFSCSVGLAGATVCKLKWTALVRLSHRNLSVHLSVALVDQSKMVQASITKSSHSAAWKTLVSGTVKLFHKFEGGHPETRFALFSLWESHFYGSVVLTSSHEKCETCK